MEAPRWARKEFNHARLRLEGNICPNCQAKIFPPRPVCPHCRGEINQPVSLNSSAAQTVYLSSASSEVAIPK